MNEAYGSSIAISVMGGIVQSGGIQELAPSAAPAVLWVLVDATGAVRMLLHRSCI
jgi:hypothetical protein